MRELFDQDAVLRQQAGMVQTNAVAQELLEVLAIGTGELHANQGIGNGGFFFGSAVVLAQQVLRCLRRFVLREVHDVNGRSLRLHQVHHGVLQQRLVFVAEFQRHRSRL